MSRWVQSTDPRHDWDERLERRVQGLERLLAIDARYCETEQKHLDEGTAERAYWHYGYLCALRDVLRLRNRAD